MVASEDWRHDLQQRSTSAPAARAGAMLGFSGTLVPDESLIAACQTCGLCLGTCPTYQQTRDPDESPRGRIRLIKAVTDGVLALDDPRFVEHTWSCILCRACETVCPSAVPYHSLAVAARAQLVDQRLLPPRRRRLGWALRHVFTRPRALRIVAGLVRLAQRLGLRHSVRRIGAIGRLAPWLVAWEAAAPELSRRFFRHSEADALKPYGRPVTRVALLDGCIMPLAFADVRRSALRVLTGLGAEVTAPSGQRCCGALHVHAGEPATARVLARRNLDAIDPDAFDAIVTDSSGCGPALEDYGNLLADDPRYAQRAHTFAAKVQDFSRAVASLAGERTLGRWVGRVTYQDACQAIHGQRLWREPRALLNCIEGLELVETAERETCCGSGGTYALTDPAMALELRERKLDALLATGATTIVTANPGCLMHLRRGLAERHSEAQVLHLAELLDQALSDAMPDCSGNQP